jgi:hypothetical protein
MIFESKDDSIKLDRFSLTVTKRHDTQHNVIQSNDTLRYDIEDNDTKNWVSLCWIPFFAECHK